MPARSEAACVACRLSWRPALEGGASPPLLLGRAQRTFQACRPCPSGRRGFKGRVADCLSDHLGGFARDLAELAHPVGAEREHTLASPAMWPTKASRYLSMNPRLRMSASILAHLFLAATCGLI